MSIVREGTQMVGMIDDGDLAREFTEEFQKVNAAVREAAGPKGKAKGSITLKIDIEAAGGTVTFSGEVVPKAPKKKRGSSMYWVMPDGSISTEHPQQMNMFPRDVNAREPINA